ncbi:hypothetical protein KJI95_17870 [Shewanella sp. JM162201]|uniref:Solute-binding protein family 3/N-terminal domain-containing protein n=1 Tax=Shewanella jiangmenensis TaxID=2837387 RepID=A0ABS5V7E6_9GAMM|nr:transporter substrate-binding domain-containing protein [Shewanella jiangmenensis]MBT1446365.1 hypothetical protein [Shewanella jiangmenensis]
MSTAHFNTKSNISANNTYSNRSANAAIRRQRLLMCLALAVFSAALKAEPGSEAAPNTEVAPSNEAVQTTQAVQTIEAVQTTEAVKTKEAVHAKTAHGIAADRSEIAGNQEALQPLTVIAVEYPPFTTKTQANNGSNFTVLTDYLQDAAITLEIRPRFLPSARAQTEIAEGNWCASFYPPPDIVSGQARFVPLSDEKVALGLFRRSAPEPFVWDSLVQLAPAKVAVLRSIIDGHFIKQFTDAGLAVEYVSDIDTGLKMLEHGRVDYAFGDSNALAQSSIPKARQTQLQFSDTHLMEVQVGVFVNPDCSAGQLIINASHQ